MASTLPLLSVRILELAQEHGIEYGNGRFGFSVQSKIWRRSSGG